MDNKNKLIITLAKNFDKDISLYQLSKISHIPYATLHRTYNKNKELLEGKKIGKSITIRLKKNNTVKNYLIVASYEETQEFLKKNILFKKIQEELPKNNYCLIIFGSYAEGKQRKLSDIDFLIINKDGKKNISFSRYETLFRISINPIFMSFNEFQEMLKDKEENLGKQILKKHIILYNQELFWNEVFKSGV